MTNNQRLYIRYAENFAETHRRHIWLGGSFLRGDPTVFSDVDISAWLDKDALEGYIYGYGNPIYISSTTNPEGILIVIYEDGVAVDLEVIESADATDNGFFHPENIKDHTYSRNSSICKEICPRNDVPYQMARLFHRSLIKHLAGKRELGVSVANEIAVFLDLEPFVTEADYRKGITSLLGQYHEKYPLDTEYRNLCLDLIASIEKNTAPA